MHIYGVFEARTKVKPTVQLNSLLAGKLREQEQHTQQEQQG